MKQPRLTPDAALQALADDPQGLPFRSLFRHGSLEVEVYKPASATCRRRTRATRSTW
jgi:hypothetical protein